VLPIRSRRVATAPTNGLGQYVVTGLAQGRYDVEVESAPPAYDGVPEAWFDSLDVFPWRMVRRRSAPA